MRLRILGLCLACVVEVSCAGVQEKQAQIKPTLSLKEDAPSLVVIDRNIEQALERFQYLEAWEWALKREALEGHSTESKFAVNKIKQQGLKYYRDNAEEAERLGVHGASTVFWALASALEPGDELSKQTLLGAWKNFSAKGNQCKSTLKVRIQDAAAPLPEGLKSQLRSQALVYGQSFLRRWCLGTGNVQADFGIEVQAFKRWDHVETVQRVIPREPGAFQTETWVETLEPYYTVRENKLETLSRKSQKRVALPLIFPEGSVRRFQEIEVRRGLVLWVGFTVKGKEQEGVERVFIDSSAADRSHAAQKDKAFQLAEDPLEVASLEVLELKAVQKVGEHFRDFLEDTLLAEHQRWSQVAKDLREKDQNKATEAYLRAALLGGGDLLAEANEFFERLYGSGASKVWGRFLSEEKSNLTSIH